MKFTNGLKGLLLGLALLLAASAWASSKASIEIVDNISVGGQQLKAGEYSLRWEGSGSNVELSILKGSKVKVPEDLRRHFPELEGISSEMPAAPTLFPPGKPAGKSPSLHDSVLAS